MLGGLNVLETEDRGQSRGMGSFQHSSQCVVCIKSESSARAVLLSDVRRSGHLSTKRRNGECLQHLILLSAF